MRRKPLFLVIALCAACLMLFSSSRAEQSAAPPEPYPGSEIYPAVTMLDDPADMAALHRLGIDFDDVRPAPGGDPTFRSEGPYQPRLATVYVTPAQAEALTNAGFTVIPIPNEGYRAYLAYGPSSNAPNAWPTFAQLVTRMENLVAAYPNLARLVSLGQSVQGRELWCLKISDNPDSEEDEPEFKYTSSLHGDETTGIEMTLRLAELLTSGYGVDPDLTVLVDEIEIWLCPISNPDGYVNGTRNNANGVNLNRDFPDPVPPVDPDDPAGREAETQAMMYFGYAHRFAQGANYHGGAQVVNYPWDAVGHTPPNSPDNTVFYNYSVGYAARNPDILNGGFPNGVTQGWEWYTLYGGLQDWSYYYRGEHHVTIEVSNVKSPPYEQMGVYWEHNRDAMLWWLQRSLTGVRGRVLDARNSAPLDATVTLIGMNAPNSVRTDPDVGDYHRLIWQGSYNLQAAANGYVSQTRSAVAPADGAATLDFALCPSAPWTVSGVVSDALDGQPLAASLSLIGSPTHAETDPATGAYTLDACPYTYTLRASAAGYYPEERAIEANANQTQDFALLPLPPSPDLSASSLKASAASALPGEIFGYTLALRNSGGPATVTVTATLPLEVTFAGELSTTQGAPVYENGSVQWQGAVGAGEAITLTYLVSVNACLPATTVFTHTAAIAAEAALPLERSAAVWVANAPPAAPLLLFPADGATGLPAALALNWLPGSDANCDPVAYTVAFGAANPPPLIASGVLTTTFDVTATLDGETYFWQITASDGLSATQSALWTFVTAPLNRLYLPLVVR